MISTAVNSGPAAPTCGAAQPPAGVVAHLFGIDGSCRQAEYGSAALIDNARLTLRRAETYNHWPRPPNSSTVKNKYLTPPRGKGTIRGVGIGVATWGGGGHASKCRVTLHRHGSVEVELGSAGSRRSQLLSPWWPRFRPTHMQHHGGMRSDATPHPAPPAVQPPSVACTLPPARRLLNALKL